MERTSNIGFSPATRPDDSESDDGEDYGISTAEDNGLDRRVVRKLDFILLPFLSLFFLVNSLDRSNVGNAETANFTKDAGLARGNLNIAVALFFSFFVALQPVGAAFGRKFGMVRWVPSCMVVWGICTCLHIWVTAAWQLYTLRIMIGILEAGFYPTTVAYLSLFYTRYEFARRLGVFYGQYALAGALGGILSYVVFTTFPREPDGPSNAWKSWQILFLIEGGLTIFIAVTGFFYLPNNAETAWFFSEAERRWASTRIAKDRMANQHTQTDDDGHEHHRHPSQTGTPAHEGDDPQRRSHDTDEAERLLASDISTKQTSPHRLQPPSNFTDGQGLTARDVVAAFTDWKVFYLLIVNILSAIPASAFAVFLPLVVSGLGFHAASANLLTAPPFLAGAAVLFLFVWWSDVSRERIRPTLYGLAILLAGLCATVLLPVSALGLRYAALCVLLAGSFVASPLTIAWLSGNIEAPGKRSVVLGINGWGNLSGVFSSLLFAERFGPGYKVPFFVTLALVALAFAGFVAFRVALVRENAWRRRVVAGWSSEEVEAERQWGKGPFPLPSGKVRVWRFIKKWRGVGMGDAGPDEGRVGEEKVTFTYGL